MSEEKHFAEISDTDIAIILLACLGLMVLYDAMKPMMVYIGI